MQERLSRITALTGILQEAKQIGIRQLQQQAVFASADESVRRLFERIGEIVAGETVRWDKSRVWGIDYTVHSTSTATARLHIGNDDDNHREDDVLAYARTSCVLSAGIQILQDAYDVSKIVQKSGTSVCRSDTFALATWHGLPVPDLSELAPMATVSLVGTVSPEIRITRDVYDPSRIVQEFGTSAGHSMVSASVAWYALPVPDLPEVAPMATVSLVSTVSPEIRMTHDVYDPSRIVQKFGTSAGHRMVSASVAWYALPVPGLLEETPMAIALSTGSIVANVVFVAESFDTSQIARREQQIESRGHTAAEVVFTKTKFP